MSDRLGYRDLRPGAKLHKIPSNRDAEVSGVSATHVWLTYLDDGSQTCVKRERFRRSNEWELATT